MQDLRVDVPHFTLMPGRPRSSACALKRIVDPPAFDHQRAGAHACRRAEHQPESHEQQSARSHPRLSSARRGEQPLDFFQRLAP
ncbi:MAG TPA: hypothetical protein VF774_27855, partial [Pseudoduganella sp.]